MLYRGQDVKHQTQTAWSIFKQMNRLEILKFFFAKFSTYFFVELRSEIRVRGNIVHKKWKRSRFLWLVAPVKTFKKGLQNTLVIISHSLIILFGILYWNIIRWNDQKGSFTFYFPLFLNDRYTPLRDFPINEYFFRQTETYLRFLSRGD